MSGRRFVLAIVIVLTGYAVPPLRGQHTSDSAPFTKAQADAGQSVYTQKCAACHGSSLTDGAAPPLAGASFFQRWRSPRTLDDLFFIVRTTMPKNAGGTLPAADYVAVLAYMLRQNGHTPGDKELTGESTLLAALSLTQPTNAKADDKRTPPAPEFIVGDGGPNPRGAGPTQEDLLAADTHGRDWLMRGHDYSGTRYSPLSQITTANVSRLKVVCIYQAAENGNFQTGPIVDRGTMYFTINDVTTAVDAVTCRPKWRHAWAQRTQTLDAVNRGAAIKDGRVVRATSDGYLLALDATDGRLLWARRIADPAKGERFTMAPLIFDNLILIGPGVSEEALAGWVGAFRLDNGERVWKFNVVPGPGEPGSETWKRSDAFPLAGGGIWGTPTIEPEREMIYFATGNPAPDFTAALRGGSNLYTNSVVALNVRTGKLAWYDQLVPADSHDWDLTHASPLYRTRMNGRERLMLGAVGKDGFLRVLDRDSRSRVFSTPITTIDNADAPVTVAGTHACPGVMGGVEWNGPAYHPKANLLAVGAVDWCTTFYMAPESEVRHVPGQIFMGGRYVLDMNAQGWITGVDAATGKVRWRYKSPRPVVGALTTTGGGLIFAGELTGDLLALDVETGVVRFRFNTGGSIGGGIASYDVNGRQYIGVASGRASRLWAPEYTGNPTVLVFALDSPNAR
jgi:alcohol dehydrogenase (cytochrome c)